MYLFYIICIHPKFVEVTIFCEVWLALNYRSVKIGTSMVFYVTFLN